MNGYVMNKTPTWMHVMKRNVGPGEKILLSDLYKQYGEKHNIEEGDAFIEWLKAVKVRDTNTWTVVYGENLEKITKDVVSEIPVRQEDDLVATSSNTMIPAISNMSIKDVVMLSVRKGREVLPRITDLKLLKYAFQEANQLAGKDSLCNLIRKRIKDLELGR